MRYLVNPIFLYACESWTLTAELKKRTQAFEMRCYRKLLNISHKDHVINEEVRKKIQASIITSVPWSRHGNYDGMAMFQGQRQSYRAQ